MTINTDYSFTGQGDTDIDAVKTLTITGSGAVDLTATGGGLAGAATSVNASGNTGVKILYGSDTGTSMVPETTPTTDSETIWGSQPWCW